MKKPIIKIAVPVEKYGALETMAQSVTLSMTANANFPTPSPSLASIQVATTTLSDAITAWGSLGNRGSQLDLANLRSAATALRNLLLKEAAYVSNLVDLEASAYEQQKFILSSGFSLKKERSPQGILEAVQVFRQHISSRINIHHVKLNWKKPQNVAVNNNVKVYFVYRSATDLFDDAVFITASTKTTFTDTTPVLGALNSYFIVPFNNTGNGITSKVVTVSVPA